MVLARKWRPKNFSELVGQAHVMQALSNALDQQRLHHAYLFTGTRGVGKTTIARIFAKALNCEEGIGSKPCGQCSTCRSIDEGRFVDLIEVDAASKTKVEDTRELLENVQYAPVQGRYKVYLIDEVHMLSKSSFNALLKTLEEPPEHVKFLLATTDPHKLPITVLSRCLQFNLMRLTQQQLHSHLAFILQQEGITYEDAALAMIAKSADGSARDALSILDQAIAYGGGQVLFDAVQAMLGLVDQQFTLHILNALADDSANGLKDVIQQLATMGVNYQALNAQLIETFHQISLLQVLGELSETALLDETTLKGFATRFSADRVQVFYQIALLAKQDMSLAPDIRIGFEMSLLRMLAFQPSRVQSGGNGEESSVKTHNLAEPKQSTRPGTFSAENAGSEAGMAPPSSPTNEFSAQQPESAQEMSHPDVSVPVQPDTPPARPQAETHPTTPPQVTSQVEAQPSVQDEVDHLAALRARLDSTLGKSEAGTQHAEPAVSSASSAFSNSAKQTPSAQTPSPDSPDSHDLPTDLSHRLQMIESSSDVNRNTDSVTALSNAVSESSDAEGVMSLNVNDVDAMSMASSRFEESPSHAAVSNHETMGKSPSAAVEATPWASEDASVGSPEAFDNVNRTPPPQKGEWVADQALPVTDWVAMIGALQLNGMEAELARQCILMAQDAQTVTLSVDPDQQFAKTELAVSRLEEQFRVQQGRRLVYVTAQGEHWTPTKESLRQQQDAQQSARDSLYQDPQVQNLMETLNLRVIESSIRPIKS